MTANDSDLLDKFVRQNSQDAFAALVQRHLNLVYSAALRQVRSPQLAEEIAQSAFTDLARNAARLKPDTVLTAWLYQVTRRTAIDVVRRESRRHLREQIATEMNAMNATADDWTHIEPLLDDAVSALDDVDRAAVLLRYFENKSLREVGQTLGTSEDAAQKRVSRAVERLREFFTKRGVTVGASGLAVVISANAVQAAPVGLAVTISTTAAAGATVAAAATATTIKTIAMTTLQKTLITATVAALTGAGIYEASQARRLRGENETIQQQQTRLAEQVKELQQQRDDAIAAQTTFQETNERLQKTVAEVPKLRGELARLLATPPAATPANPAGLDPNDPATQTFLAARAKAEQITKCLQQMPDKAIPELKILTDIDWLRASKEAKFDTDADIRKTLSQLRSLAKNHLPFGSSLWTYTQENNGELPSDLAQLKPYVKSNLNDPRLDDASLDAIFERYQLLHTGKVKDYPPDTWFIVEKASVDKDFDTRIKWGPGTGTIISTGLGETGDPDGKSY